MARLAARATWWSVGRQLGTVLSGGGRLLAVGNGGSAAEAQHLTGELVGRFLEDRRPFSALALCAESSSLTAILNDYGPEEVFARQVEAHGRPGDILVAALHQRPQPQRAGRGERATQRRAPWGLTGPGPNPLTMRCAESVSVRASSTAAIQAVHLVAIHALCAALDAALGTGGAATGTAGTGRCGIDDLAGRGMTGRVSPPRIVVVGDVMLDRTVTAAASA